MSKINWLIDRTNENNGFFKATFKENFIHQVNVEAMKLGAILYHKNHEYTWTSKGKGYSLIAKGPKHIGERGTIWLEIFDLEFSNENQKVAATLIDQARDCGVHYDAICTMQKQLAEMMKN